VAGKEEIILAARTIGVQSGWEAVTIRSVAKKLGYTSPLLYEHFRDKQDLLTQIAVEAIALFERELKANLPAEKVDAALRLVEQYWMFMLEHRQLYRLMNGMDGVPIDRRVVSKSAQPLCTLIADVVRPLMGDRATQADAQMLADELWALLHGMASLYLDRSVPFDLTRVSNATMKLVQGARIGRHSIAS
jgi:AcrR family transcriptional regulator